MRPASRGMATERRSADHINADARLLLRWVPSPDDLFRFDAGRDEHHAKGVFERRIDRRAPDDPRGGGHLRLDDLGDAFRFGDRHVVPARDVDQHAVSGRDIDLKERRVDGLLDRLDGAVVPDRLALAKADHRDPAALHDRLHVVEVEVHEAGLRDDFGEPLDGPHEDLVGELEREVQRLPRQSLNLAFKFADEVLMRSIKGLTEIITKPGLVNLDFNDVKTIMKGGGVAMIGLGESQAVGDNRAVEAIEEAINSPLLEVDVSTAHGVLINVTGGNDMTISEAERVAEVVQAKVSPTARSVWC